MLSFRSSPINYNDLEMFQRVRNRVNISIAQLNYTNQSFIHVLVEIHITLAENIGETMISFFLFVGDLTALCMHPFSSYFCYIF